MKARELSEPPRPSGRPSSGRAWKWITRSLAAGMLAAAPMLATDDGRPIPPPSDTLDCSKDNNAELCIECGGSKLLACCWDDDCKVINKPPEKTGLQPPGTRGVPVAPGRLRLDRKPPRMLELQRPGGGGSPSLLRQRGGQGRQPRLPGRPGGPSGGRVATATTSISCGNKTYEVSTGNGKGSCDYEVDSKGNSIGASCSDGTSDNNSNNFASADCKHGCGGVAGHGSCKIKVTESTSKKRRPRAGRGAAGKRKGETAGARQTGAESSRQRRMPTAGTMLRPAPIYQEEGEEDKDE